MDYITLLHTELRPAFGCTEPIALAYGGARCRDLVKEPIQTIHARCSANIIKNVKSVTIPNAGGEKGLCAAALLGAIIGHAERELEVLEAVTDTDRAMLQDQLIAKQCTVDLVEGVDNLYIELIARSAHHEAVVRIEGSHTNITFESLDGEVLLDNPPETCAESDTCTMDFQSIYDFAKTGDITDIIPVIKQQIEYNTAISNEGLANKYGSNIGAMLLMDEDTPSLETLAQARAAAGSDARMSGCPLPVVICSGSGNQGLSVSMPVITAGEAWHKSEDEVIRALVFANLLTLYIKKGVGKLSAYCGAVSASVGGVAGVAFLKGEPQAVIEETIVNGLASLSGIVCDGAKPSCAGKIAISVGAGFMAYKQARIGHSYEKGDGIVANSVDETIRSIGHIAKEGMKETDVVILQEMLKH